MITRLWWTLDTEGVDGPVEPGSTITGSLRVVSFEPIHITGWEAAFVSDIQFSPRVCLLYDAFATQYDCPSIIRTVKAESGRSNTFTKHCNSAVDFNDHGSQSDVSLDRKPCPATPSQQQKDNGDPIRVDRAVQTHHQPSEFFASTSLPRIKLQVPDLLPDTWNSQPMEGQFDDDDVSVGYKVQVKLYYSGLDESTMKPVGPFKTRLGEMDVVIKNQVDARQYEVLGPGESMAKRTVGILGCRQGPILSILSIHQRALVLGETAQCEVKFLNRSPRKIRKISLTLYHEITFEGNNCKADAEPELACVRVSTEELSKVIIPREVAKDIVKKTVELPVPVGGLSSGSLSNIHCLHSRFFVRLKVKFTFGSMHSDVDIFLGTQRSPEKGKIAFIKDGA